jgi:hypothetical protein
VSGWEIWSEVQRVFSESGRLAAYMAAMLALAALPLAAPRLRSEALIGCAGIVAAIVFYRQAAVGLAFVALLAYTAGQYLVRQPPQASAKRSRWKLACLAMFLLAAGFFWLQWAITRPFLASAAPFLGPMILWNVIRLVSFFWEIGSGRSPLPSVRGFVVWLVYPFTLFGPVIRLSEFTPQLGGLCPGRHRIAPVAWLADVAIGVLQIAVGLVLLGMTTALDSRGVAGRLAIVLVAAPWAFLFQAAGFFRAMEACSRTWNLTLPPSFNRPFGRPNISEFWANWNMTVTSVFRDYIFYNRWGRRRPNVYLNSLVLFVLVGAWHSANAYWVIWGAVHGIGFCIYLLYKQKTKSLHALFRGRLGRLAAIVVTYLFVVGAWALPPQLLKLWSMLLP